ncbi:MAG: ATP phosphoribosyltransferase regulatory subunit [Nitrospinae bacterium]|nr:ATP phosphoribosyltransferase regulatory subunit [Nitrospinota bacterium]
MKLHITAIPQGTRTFLFEEAEQKRRIEQEIHSCLKSRGFQEIVTPLLEYYDSAVVGMGDDGGRIMRFAEEDSGMAIALRPDITSQVARSAATHLNKMPLPLRLCYNGPVFRRARKGKGEQYVLNQAGMEIIGDGETSADAEIVASVMAVISAVGLKSYSFSIGHAGILGSLLKGMEPSALEKIKSAVSKKDKSAIAEELKKSGAPKNISEKITGLAGLFGDLSVLGEAEKICAGHAGAEAGIKNLKGFLEKVKPAGLPEKLVLDFGEIRGWGYYTGVIMELFFGSMLALGAGGRYDSLVARFGRDVPAVGFAFDVDMIISAVMRENSGVGFTK